MKYTNASTKTTLPMTLSTMTHIRSRFRMRKHLFLCIVDALQSRFEYFQLRYDALGKCGWLSLTKCTSAMWMLATGITTDCVNEYLKTRESPIMECMKNFAARIIQVLGEEYLQRPTRWCWLSLVDGGSSWFSWPIMKHWLYVLGMEELSIGLKKSLYKRYIQSIHIDS